MRTLIETLRSRLRNMVRRAALEAVKDSLETQVVQLSSEERVRDQVDHLQTYGLTARAKPGAEAVVFNVEGDPTQPVALLVADRRYRLTGLAEGEVALYDDQGQMVLLGRDGIQVLSAGTVAVGTDQEELLDLVSQLMQQLANTTTSTALGPQPLAAASAIADLQARLDSIKGTL